MRFLRSSCLAALVGCAIGCSSPTTPDPREPALYADIWMQTAAEYYAICEQTFALAHDRITVLAEQQSADRPLAIVMDLDETVIDNSGYQTYLARSGASYSEESWEAYVRYQSEEPEPSSVPGAAEFISRMEGLGIAVIFISNRSESSREYTLRTLSRLGIDTAGDRERFLLRTTTSSKAERRAAVEERYQIVAWFGDNLADFATEFEDSVSGTPAVRLGHAEQSRSRWGTDWFVLPNPTYGDFLGVLEPPLAGHLSGPSDVEP